MVTVNNTSDQQTKDFLQRIDIKTMKKDLARLREADSLEERAKISKIPIPAPRQEETPDNIPFTQPTQEIPRAQKLIIQEEPEIVPSKPLAQEPNQAILQRPGQDKPKSQENTLEQKIKQYADENEKQQIYLLESRQLSLQRQPQTSQIKEEMEKIGQSFNAIYSQILEREKAKRKAAQEASLKKMPIEATGPKSIQKPEPITRPEPREKEYFKKISPAAREKLADSTKTEQQQRRKFMEDVEKWAQEEQEKII